MQGPQLSKRPSPCVPIAQAPRSLLRLSCAPCAGLPPLAHALCKPLRISPPCACPAQVLPHPPCASPPASRPPAHALRKSCAPPLAHVLRKSFRIPPCACPRHPLHRPPPIPEAATPILFWLIIPLLHRQWLKTPVLHGQMTDFSVYASSLHAKPEFSANLQLSTPTTAARTLEGPGLARRSRCLLAAAGIAKPLATFWEKTQQQRRGPHRRSPPLASMGSKPFRKSQPPGHPQPFRRPRPPSRPQPFKQPA